MEIQPIQSFSATLTALSAMITPAVLIMACGQLILTTSQRLARTMDRIRKLSEGIEELLEKNNRPEQIKARKKFLEMLMGRSAQRARKLQLAMSILYVALSAFVCTSISIGLVDVFNWPFFWVPLALGLLGAALMFGATILLITETRIALGSVHREVSYFTSDDMNGRR